MPKYGDFGNLSDSYAKARKGFPEEVLDCFWQFFKTKNPKILDLGCGTGISTRQLAQKGARVIGADKDEKMLHRAREASGNIEYINASARALPFEEGSFEGVGAFSAFHWFAGLEAAGEIKHVLRSGGVLFTANKVDTGNFRPLYRKILKKYSREELPNPTKDYDFSPVLEEAGFSDIREKIFPVSEFYTLPEVLDYIRSVSVWNLIPTVQKQNALQELKAHFQDIATGERIERKLEILTYVAKK